MKNRYKIILSNRKIYKEIEMPMEVPKLVVGTDIHCDVRLRKELFFEQFELLFKCENGKWNISCSENVYVTTDNILKMLTKELIHGDEIQLKYQESDADILKISFMIDFEFEKNDYERCIDISEVDELYIGGMEKCQIFLNNPYIGKDYIVLRKQKTGYLLEERNTKYGVYINDTKKTGKIALKSGDFIALANYSFYLKGKYLYTSRKSNAVVNGLKVYDVAKSRSVQKYPHFNRSTRIQTVIPNETIAVLDPPPAPKKPQGNIVMQLLPAIIMLGVTILFRVVLSDRNNSFIWVSLISMTLGICTSVATIISDRKKYKDEAKERNETYGKYVEEKKEEIEQSRKFEKEILDNTYLSSNEEIRIVNDFTSDLFNRNPEDVDYLEIRLGTGSREALRKIEYKKQENFNGQDELTILPEKIAIEYKSIKDVPITLDLKVKNAVGFVGEREKLYAMVKNVTLDIVTRQYFKHVKLFYILDDLYQKEFKWLRQLPHVQNDVIGVRNIACDSDSKNILFEYLYKELNARNSADKQEKRDIGPNMVVFVYNDLGLKRHPISKFIDCAAELGVTFLFFDEYQDFLPHNCDDIVILKDDSNGKLISSDNSLFEQEFTYTEIENRTAENIALKLAPVYCDEVSLEGSLTKNITLFELLNILNVEDINLERNWRTSEVYKTLAAPLGVKSKSQVVSLDLNEKHHGPHGLVAGTTGSGKSEILQSYILSMSVLYHPYEVGFVIIDFKGGGMVNQFSNLPHLVGAITNIDGREIDRSLLSIKAELKKRQALFAEYGVNHVDAYIKLYKKGEAKIPLPHLILIVDEFAELKMDQPEFMKELISAARIGRSLGIHLILATQKPSGVVDAQIWSNSKFKLCLKVQNKEDSNEVLKTPLAAEIREPGRAYLQVGNNEIFDLFQSAYSGGPAVVDDSSSTKKFTIEKLNLSGKRTVVYSQKPEQKSEERETQLAAIVKYIANYCAEQGIQKLPGICLPPLKEEYAYSCVSQINNTEGAICVPMGIFDDPDRQLQAQVNLDVSEGNTFILGASQYGKTSMLQTIIRGLAQNYTPDEVNMYILDFASMALKVFSELKHVGGVLVSSDDEKLKLFFKMMKKEVKQRKEKFSQMGITSYQSYREAGYRDIPQIVVLLDNLLAFRELANMHDEDFLELCREGSAVGISIVATAQQISGIGYKYLATFNNKYGLSCNDKAEYSNLYDRCRMQPKNVPGRALVCIDKIIYEFQAYLAFEGEKEIQRVEAMKTFIALRNAECGNSYARKIPEVPALLTPEYLEQTFGKLSPGNCYLGIDYETVEASILNFAKEGYLAILGKENSGRSNYLKYLFSNLQKSIFTSPVEAYVIDDFEQKLLPLNDYGFVEQYTTEVSAFEVILERVSNLCELRMERYKLLGGASLEDEPLLMVVVNNSGVYDAGKITKDAATQWKNLVKTYKNMKVMFILAALDNTAVSYSSSELMKHVKESKNILYFDDLANIKVTDIPLAIQKQFRKPIEVGDAFYITTTSVNRIKTPLFEEE